MILLKCALFFVVLSVSAKEEFRIVNTTLGAIRGKHVVSYGGHEGYAFVGIPHAKPPLGELRWKEAQEPEGWSGVLDTLNYRNACISDPKKTYKNDVGGPVSEDCLYINVFSSKKCLQKGGCSVMAVLHGGGHKTDSAVIYREDIVINNFANEERNIVVVILPYRIGPLGNFQLTEGSKTSVDTCIEIRDCVFAFRWIQREISAFGGDPKRVTVLGHSAGAILIQQIAVLPNYSNLFSQVISMSRAGTGADLSHTVSLKYSREITKLLGCADAEELFTDIRKVEEILKCMRSKPGLEILDGLHKMYLKVENQWGTWVDGEVFPKYERELLEEVRRPMNVLVGSTAAETRNGKYILTKTGSVNRTRLHEVCSMIGYWRNYEHPDRFIDACVEFYGKKERVEFIDDDLEYYLVNAQFVDAFTRTGGNAFMYNYAYTGAKKVWTKYNPVNYRGPMHTEDYIYVFGVQRNTSLMNERDFVIERTYTGLLANFVNTGDPSYQEQMWEKWDSRRRNFFEIDFDKNLSMTGMKDGYWLRVKEFYEEIAVREGGEWTPLEDFPKEADCLQMSDLINGFKGMWENITLDKTLNATQGIYWMTVNHIEHLREKRNAAQLRTLAEEEEEGASTVDWLTLLMAAAPVALVAYIGFWKFREYRKRRNYTLIED